jgi:hypothetical protein
MGRDTILAPRGARHKIDQARADSHQCLTKLLIIASDGHDSYRATCGIEDRPDGITICTEARDYLPQWRT